MSLQAKYDAVMKAVGPRHCLATRTKPMSPVHDVLVVLGKVLLLEFQCKFGDQLLVGGKAILEELGKSMGSAGRPVVLFLLADNYSKGVQASLDGCDGVWILSEGQTYSPGPDPGDQEKSFTVPPGVTLVVLSKEKAGELQTKIIIL
jgi:hypothetical protein